VFVATKMGRRAEQLPENYVLDNFRAWNDRSRANLGVDTLDLVQLHCPPSAVYSSDEVFDALDTLVAEKRIANYAVSVETCAEALAAIARPGVASVQIILNAFRLKPLEEVLPAAARRGSASSPGCRWPPACSAGSTPGRRCSPPTTTAATTGTASRSTRARRSPASTTRRVLRRPRSSPRWPRGRHARADRAALDHPAARVTSVIPGARSVAQARANAEAAGLAPLDGGTLAAVRDLYDRRIRGQVHARW